MLSSQKHGEVFEFGSFRLEVAERRLLKAGKPISLTPKAFDVLLTFVRHDGKLLAKQELMDLVWPDQTVEETNLANNISQLRKVLGTTESEDPYIQTVPRHGYRFQGNVKAVAPSPPSLVIERYTVTEVVTEEFDPPDLPSEALAAYLDVSAVEVPADPPTRELGPGTALPSRPSTKPPRRWKFAVLGLGVLGLGVLGLGAAYVFSRFRATETGLPPPRLVPITNLPGDKRQAAFSPDGRQIAFTLDKLGTHNSDIYVTQVGGLEAKQITDDPSPETRPVWSPDGRYLAFLREKNSSQELIVKSLDSGTERSLGMFAGGLSWSPDGNYMAVQEKSDTGDTGWISLLKIDTGTLVRVTTPPTGYDDRRPVFSPDGRRLAFLRYLNRMGNMFVVSVSGGTPSQVTFDEQIIDSQGWTPDGRELIYASNRGGAFLIWRISSAGGEPRLVGPVTGKCDEVALDRSGTRLIYRQNEASSSIWRFELGGEGPRGGRIVRAATPIIKPTQLADSPCFSPDGKRLAFSSDQSGSYEIWTCDADGGHPVRLTFFNQGVTGTPRWSPDGKSIAFDADHDGKKRVYVIDARGGTPRPLTDEKEFNNLPAWSSDGRWIYLCLHTKNGLQIRKIPSAGGTPVQVTSDGGWECAESPDGKRLYYTKGRYTPGMWEMDLASGKETPVPELAEVVRKRYWAVTRDGIVFAAPDAPDTWAIKFMDFKTRRIKNLAIMLGPPVESPSGLAVSPDQTVIVYAQSDQFGSTLTMVENFR